jgi:hypothetical protein
LLLPRLEPHPVALVLGLGGAALGVATARFESMAGRSVFAWLALAAVVAGMLMYSFLTRPGVGWQVDLASRRVQPLGFEGEGVELQGQTGWLLVCVAGSKRRSLAIDLKHEDGGRPRRLFQTRAGAGHEEHALLSQLTDVLADKLGARREGLTF